MTRRVTWIPRNVAWWTSVLFAIGSFCFALGAFPLYAHLVGSTADNVTYFVGSLFFTAAAALQLWQSDHRLAFWASLVQLAGTLFFNRSTFQALNKNLSAAGENRNVWRPDALGSVAFLVSSVLACIDVRRASREAPRTNDWWAAWWNMVGSIAFGVSAAASHVVTDSGTLRNAELTNLGTFAGAVCFFVAALIVMPRRGAPAVDLAPPRS